jgi:hypothetical protein
LIVSGLNHSLHSGDGGDSYDQEDPPTKAQQEGWVSEQQRMNYKINEFALDAVMWVDGAAELSALKWAATTATVKGWFTFGNKGYSSFAAFKAANGAAGKGMAWHHIVEQGGSNVANFGASKIHNASNLIKLPHGAGSIHAKVSGYYSSKQAFTGGQTVRQWLSGQSYKQQYNFGIKTMKQFGWKP